MNGQTPATTAKHTGINRTIQEMLDRGERWPVKVGADSGALDISIDPQNAASTTVTAMRQKPRPTGLPNKQYSGQFEQSIHASRADSTESTQYQISGWILGAKWEDSPQTGDDDFHIVISDNPQDRTNTMVVEIPNPRYVPDSSPFAGLIGQVRQQFSQKVGNLTEKMNWFAQPIHAAISGIGFWDYSHGQTGVAPNAIELHPVLRINF